MHYAMEAAQDGIWDWDIVTGEVYYSPRWARLLGYEPEEVPQRVEFFFQVLHPDDIAVVKQGVEDHLAGRTEVKQDEVRLRMKSGEYRWFYDRGKVVVRDEAGTPLRMVGTITDITARKVVESALRVSDAALKAISQGVMITDPAGVILSANPAFERITGRVAADLVGRASDGLWAGLADPGIAAALTRARREGTGFSVEALDRRADGSTFWNEVTITPVRDEGGVLTHLVEVTRDVTERRRFEERLRQSQKMDAIGQLASGVAHDFNNILGAILGNADLALTEVREADPVREYLSEIRGSTLRAKSLVQQILAFSRQQPRERRVIRLGPVVQEALKFLRATIPAQVELVANVGATTPRVMADATEMHQVLVNLCTNAWHSLEDRPGRIEITLEGVHLDAGRAAHLSGLRGGPCLCLSVTDTGKGMEPATLARIFEPFFTTRELGGGTGLGLSVVHGIVHGHDGAISVTSQPGRGSRFEVFLPAVAGPETGEVTGAGKWVGGNGELILYLDDERALVSIASRVLERLGYRVVGCTTAEEALQAFDARPGEFGLVITDMNMPRTSGLEVAREILRRREDIPVVLTSGRVMEDLLQQAQVAGVREVLHKPASFEELASMAARCVGHRGLAGSG